MPRGPIRFALLLTSMLAGLLTAATPAHADPAPPVKILLEGDSITQGFDGDYTWRYRLWKELVRQGISSEVDLVGTRHDPYVKPGYRTSAYLDPHFDSDHFALVGSTLQWHANQVAAELAADQADVVVLGAGINDLRAGASPATVEGRLRAWISHAREARPDVKIVVSPVLDVVDSTRPWLAAAIRDVREREAQVVADLTTTTSPISLAATETGWSASAYTYDGLHPTPTGETHIAQRIAEALDARGYVDFPSAISIQRPTPWARIARVQVRSSRGSAVLTWDQQAISRVRIWMRRTGGGTFKVVPGMHAGGSWTSPRLTPRAHYEFRIQMVKGTLLSPVGPISRLAVGRGAPPAGVSRASITPKGLRWVRAAGATSYVVRYRSGHATKWHVRHTRKTSVRAKHVREATIRASNPAGVSPALHVVR